MLRKRSKLGMSEQTDSSGIDSSRMRQKYKNKASRPKSVNSDELVQITEVASAKEIKPKEMIIREEGDHMNQSVQELKTSMTFDAA